MIRGKGSGTREVRLAPEGEVRIQEWTCGSPETFLLVSLLFWQLGARREKVALLTTVDAKSFLYATLMLLWSETGGPSCMGSTVASVEGGVCVLSCCCETDLMALSGE